MVDVTALQAKKLLPADAHWAAVILSAPVQPDELIAVAASYDQTGRYGAQTPFNDQLAFHWEGGKWEVDSMHNSLVTVGNGGNKPVRAQLTIFYNEGKEQYQLEQLLAPDEQIELDFGKLIHDQVPDKDGHTLPPELTAGTYRVRDLTDIYLGNLYEGKVILDKTFGHATYGCMTCCGYDEPYMEYDPLGVPVSSFGDQNVQAQNACFDIPPTSLNGDMTRWWTDDTAIATATMNQINGVAAGSTNHHASGDYLAGDTHSVDNKCPQTVAAPLAGTNVQVPTYFGPTGYAAVSGDCPAGASGTFINVSDQVLDQNGNAMQVSGVTPQELVCTSALGCQSSYQTFSTPSSTTSAGTFNDTPIGTCFDPTPPTNLCVTVTVKYQAYIFGPTNSYPIATAASRTDCVQGEQDQISGNPTAYNKTYKTGTVP